MRLLLACACIATLFGCATSGLPGDQALVTKDHYVRIKSSAPGMKGAETAIHVREIAAPASSRIPRNERAVLFIHGGTNPGTIVFDFPRPDYSWMRHFANAGYDTFTLDFTGYGRSTRPPPMDDACNLPGDQQKRLIPAIIPAPCKASFSGPIATMQSEEEEIAAVVEFVRKLRGVDKVAIVAWSRGGPRSSRYALANPDKVSRMFFLAPDYGRDWSMDKPVATPTSLTASWSRTDTPPPAGCEGYFDPAIRDIARTEVVAMDPLGAKWGGALRALPSNKYGMSPEGARRIRTPVAMATGALDTVVLPARVREFYEDLGSSDKVFIDIACTGHATMWEKPRAFLFRASLEWIRDGKIDNKSRGELRVGY